MKLRANRRDIRKRLCRFGLIAFAILFILLVVEEVAFKFQNPPVRSTSPNAIWIRHFWVDKDHTDAEYRALAVRLRNMEINDVYFRTKPEAMRTLLGRRT